MKELQKFVVNLEDQVCQAEKKESHVWCPCFSL